MYFNILVGEEKRGRVSNHDDFMKLLKPEETKKIFETDSWSEMEAVFKKAKETMGEDSWIEDINGIVVNYITDGISVNTLVFYF